MAHRRPPIGYYSAGALLESTAKAANPQGERRGALYERGGEAEKRAHAKVDTTLNVYTQVIEDSVQRSRVGDELFIIVHKPEKECGANSL